VECLRSCFAETTVHGCRSCSIPREREQADFPRLAPLWWNLAVGFCQALSADKRSPEGLGAWENPTGRLHSERASRGKSLSRNGNRACFSLILNHYYLQEAREGSKNPRVIWRYPLLQPTISETGLGSQEAAINCRSTSFPTTPLMALAIWPYSRLSSHGMAKRLGTKIVALVSVT
jgi:hypothetical protein